MADFTNQIQEIYIGLLGRAADKPGFDYWKTQLNTDLLTIEQLRANIVNEQPEYASGLGTMTRTEVVTTLYERLFKREPEAAGLDYWVNGGGSTVNVDQLVLALSDGAASEDRTTLNNKIDAAYYYTRAIAAYREDTAQTAVEVVDSSPFSMFKSVAYTIEAGTNRVVGSLTDFAGAVPDPGVEFMVKDSLQAILEENTGGSDLLARAEAILISDMNNEIILSSELTGSAGLFFLDNIATLTASQYQLLSSPTLDAVSLNELNNITVSNVTNASPISTLLSDNNVDRLEIADDHVLTLTDFELNSLDTPVNTQSNSINPNGYIHTSLDDGDIILNGTDLVNTPIEFEIQHSRDAEIRITGFDLGDSIRLDRFSNGFGINSETMVAGDGISANGTAEYLIRNDGTDTTILLEPIDFLGYTETTTITLLGVTLTQDNFSVSGSSGATQVTYDLL